MPIFKRFTAKNGDKPIKTMADETPILDEITSLVQDTSDMIDSTDLVEANTDEDINTLDILSPATETPGFKEPSEAIDEALMEDRPIATNSEPSTLELDSNVSLPILEAENTEAPISQSSDVLLKDIRNSISSSEREDIQRRADLGEMRLDVARITSDIDSGEALYRRAQQRVGNLMQYIEKAEVDFSLLDRLEPENRRLKSHKRTLTAELENQKARIAVLSASVETYRTKAQEAHAQFSSTTAKLAQTSRMLEDKVSEAKRLKDNVSRLTLEMDRAKTDKDVEARENQELRTKITQLSATISEVKTDKLNLAKTTEALKIDYEDQRTARETLSCEVTDLRNALSDAQSLNNQFKSELMRVHEEIKNFKTQYEYNILTRDERIIALERKITDLTDNLRHKEEIVESAARDVSALRKERSAQDMDRQRLEKTLREQTIKLQNAHEDLIRSKQDKASLDQRYKDAASALGMAQERRTAISTTAEPDIQPHTNVDINDYDLDDVGLNFSADALVEGFESKDTKFTRGVRPAKSIL